MLAIALCLERYMKGHLSNAARDSIESDWVNQWKDQLENPCCKPRQVMRTYLDDLDMSEDVLDVQFNWACWDLTDEVDNDSERHLAHEHLPLVTSSNTTFTLSSSTSPTPTFNVATSSTTDTVTPLLPPAEPPLVPNKTPAIMMPHTVADHAGPSLYAPHPAPLMRFKDTTFPTPDAYNNVPYSAHDYFPAGSFFHCSMIEQLTPPISALNLNNNHLTSTLC
jgi:hypothetical protein